MGKDECGVIVIEAVIWLPLLILAYLAFLITSLYITQRIVLDRAVAQACLEATDWLSGDIKKYDEVSSFSGMDGSITLNPYWNTIQQATNPYTPMEESTFKEKVSERVTSYATWSLIGGYKDVTSVTVEVDYDYYWIYGELTVSASQKVKFPLNLNLLGMKPEWNYWEFRSTAKGMVFHTASLMNDADFIFDAVRILSGGKADVDNLRSFIGSLPDKLPH